MMALLPSGYKCEFIFKGEAMYHLRTPKDDIEFATYYHFRWEMLRKPLINP